MAERVFRAEIEIAREAGDVFVWIADYRNVPRVLDGVSRWEPVGTASTGRGARFAVKLQALGLSLDDTLVLDEWDEPRAIHWRSEDSPVSGGWRFDPVAGGTEVTMTVGYQPPGGFVGGLVAGRVDGFARARLQQALERMKAILEGER